MEQIGENPTKPKSREDLGRYMKEALPEGVTVTDSQINTDLRKIVADAANNVVLLGNERSPARSYILEEHQKSAIEAEERRKKSLKEERWKARSTFKFTNAQVS